MNDLRRWTDPLRSFPFLIAALVRGATERGATSVEVIFAKGEDEDLPTLHVSDNGMTPTADDIESFVRDIPRAIAAEKAPNALFGFVHHARAVRVQVVGATVEFDRAQLEGAGADSEIELTPTVSASCRHTVVSLIQLGWVQEKDGDRERTSTRLAQELSRILLPEELGITKINADRLRQYDARA